MDALIKAGFALHAFAQAVAQLSGVDYRSKYAAISQATLLINGDLDHGMVKQEARLLAVGQRASSHRFENCKHGMRLLRSREFAGLINAFARCHAETWLSAATMAAPCMRNTLA